MPPKERFITQVDIFAQTMDYYSASCIFEANKAVVLSVPKKIAKDD